MTALPQRLLLVPLGSVARPLLSEAAHRLRELFGPSVSLAAPQERPGYAFNKDRNQYHSAAILRHLAQRHRGGAGPVLGVTDVDLFVPDTPFVFGDADRGEGVAVFSLARLAHGPDGRPVDPERLTRRVQAEAVHAYGHLIGLSHCHDMHCAMMLSHKATDADKKGAGLCASCRSAAGIV